MKRHRVPVPTRIGIPRKTFVVRQYYTRRCFVYCTVQSTLADHGLFVDRGENKMTPTQYREYRFFPEHIKYDTTVEIEQHICFDTEWVPPARRRRRLHYGFYNTTYGNSRLIATLNVIFSVIHRTLERGVSE